MKNPSLPEVNFLLFPFASPSHNSWIKSLLTGMLWSRTSGKPEDGRVDSLQKQKIRKPLMLEETKLVWFQTGRKKKESRQGDWQDYFKESPFCWDRKTDGLKCETWIMKDMRTSFFKYKDCLCEFYKSFHPRGVQQTEIACHSQGHI